MRKYNNYYKLLNLIEDNISKLQYYKLNKFIAQMLYD